MKIMWITSIFQKGEEIYEIYKKSRGVWVHLLGLSFINFFSCSPCGIHRGQI